MNTSLINFNFLPGMKRTITLIVGVAIFAWQEAALAGFVSEVPNMVYSILALFGFNALAQAPKNTPPAA